jgi:hypothetical protein
MQLMDFIRALLPRLDKSDIMEDIRMTKSELQTVVTPCYSAARDLFKVNKLKSAEADSLSKIFYRNYDLSTSKKSIDFVAEIDSKISNVLTNLLFVEGQLESLLEQDIIAGGLTAKKAILVRAVEHMSFISRYSVDLLNYLYMFEAKAASKEGTDDGDITPAAIKSVEFNIANFSRLLGIYGMEPKEYIVRMGKVPEVVLNDRTEQALSAVYTDAKIDPFNLYMVKGFEASPIYRFRMLIAEWQASRYKSMQDKKRALELRLLHLKLVNEKNHNPQMEQEIRYIQSRIEKTEASMRKMEDSVR